MDERLEFSGEGDVQDPLKVNWGALLLAVLKDYSPERAFRELVPWEMADRKQKWFEADIITMMQFRKEGVTFYEIGKRMGCDQAVVHRVLQQYEKKKRKEGGAE